MADFEDDTKLIDLNRRESGDNEKQPQNSPANHKNGRNQFEMDEGSDK